MKQIIWHNWLQVTKTTCLTLDASLLLIIIYYMTNILLPNLKTGSPPHHVKLNLCEVVHTGTI